MLVFLEILILLLVGMYNGEHKYFYLDKVFLQIFLFQWKKNLVAITLHMRSVVSHGVTPPSPSLLSPGQNPKLKHNPMSSLEVKPNPQT